MTIIIIITINIKIFFFNRYKVTDVKSGNNFGHVQKSEKNGITKGQYHILLPDGRKQVVKYYADDDGFHADVTYEKFH